MYANPQTQRQGPGRWNVLILLLPVILTLVVTACRPNPDRDEPPVASPTATGATRALDETPTAISPPPTTTPSPTPVPLAATVNGEPVTLAVFETSLARFNAAQSDLGIELASGEAARRVLDELISQRLLAQAAVETGYQGTEATVTNRLEELAAEIGGTDALSDWMATNFYTEESFREDLRLSLAAAWMRDQIAAEVPETAEQVYARQILLYNPRDAEDILAQLQTGADFDALARAVDPQGYGDLGWFPRGYLTEPAIEDMAFSLQPGEYSDIIETGLGYHIVMVADRQSDRPLEPAARLALQVQALEAWLEVRRNQSEITILLSES